MARSLPWTVVCRTVVDGIAAVVHQMRTRGGARRVDQMVRARDYDAVENRWRVEPVWPAPEDAANAARPAAGPSRWKKRRRKRRGSRGYPS